jgi:magnesium-transporting ATPase (P-type)
MDEVLELVDVLADLGLEGVFTWLLRVVGIVAILAGLGLWLLTESGLLVMPAVLIVVGLISVAVPEILLVVVELAG